MPTPASKTSKPKTSPAAKARLAYHKVPTRTPADDPGRFSKTPHEYGDVLITPDAKGRTRLGGALQRDLVYWIERHTWGKNTGTPTKVVRPEFAKLSLAQLAKLCGSDRRTVARAIADLAARGIIEARDRTGCGATVAKMYKLTPEKWRRAPYYEAKAVELATVEEDVPEEDGGEMPIPDATDAPEREVSTGRVSKPQAVAVSPSKGAPVVSIRLVYRSVDLPFPVAFKAHPGRNGRVQISCRAVALQNFANPSPPEIPATVDTERVNAYTAYVEEFVYETWGKAADKRLIESIISESHAAPLWLFQAQVTEKFKTRGAAKKHVTGLLIGLARDAAAAQAIREKADAAAEARRQAQRPQYSAAELAAFEAEANAPATPAPEKCPACKGSGNGKKEWANRHGEYKAWPTKCGTCKGTGRKVAE